tara:strand:- start:51 stop:527 length:477 start_codon:yes stop_codon:yes gene_type:complete
MVASEAATMQSHDGIFEASFTRVIGPGPGVSAEGEQFFADFYQRFTARSSDAKLIFSKTDMSHQSRMLLKSVYHLVSMYATSTVSDHIIKIAEKHSGLELDIPAVLYDDWMEALIETVSARDPRFNQDVALAWRFAFAPGLAVMRHYASIHRKKTTRD